MNAESTTPASKLSDAVALIRALATGAGFYTPSICTGEVVTSVASTRLLPDDTLDAFSVELSLDDAGEVVFSTWVIDESNNPRKLPPTMRSFVAWTIGLEED